MELIYTDKNLNDVGVLKEAVSDFAFGKDENDFEVVTTKKNAKLILGGYVYYENTEYGGIVDSVKASNNSDEITYNGRTWHGLLNSFVMDYDSQYLNYNGTQYTLIEGVSASDLISELIEKTDLPFTVQEYNFTLEPVSVDARLGLYDFLCTLLKPSKMKLYFRYNKGIQLYVSGASQYDDENNFDSKQMMITSNKGRKFTNHFVLHNTKDEADRTLHLYTDASGNIQPYSEVENPLEDSDYILTDDNKVLTGADEVCTLLEDSSGQENYKLLTDTHAPKDWSYADYYEYVLKEGSTDEFEYKKLESNDQFYQINGQYQPTLWDIEWANYFKREKNTQGEPVQLTTDDAPKTTTITAVIRDGSSPQVDPPYLQLNAKQWAEQWDKSNICTRTWDGNKWVYTKAEGITAYGLEKLGSEPTDWGANKGSYWVDDSYRTFTFQRGTKQKNKIVAVGGNINLNQYNYKKTKVENKKGKKVTLVTLCPNLNTWVKTSGNNYYRKIKDITDNSPASIEVYCKRRGRSVGGANSGFKFSEVQNVYRRYEREKKDPPVWQEPNQDHSNPKGYFLVEDASTGWPNFQTLSANYDLFARAGAKKSYSKDTYYKKVTDHFVNLIEKAKEELQKEIDELEKTSADLNIETYEFDVGDYVGGINPLTNEPFKSIVTKKIAKIDSFKASVSYEIG